MKGHNLRITVVVCSVFTYILADAVSSMFLGEETFRVRHMVIVKGRGTLRPKIAPPPPKFNLIPSKQTNSLKTNNF